MSRLPTTVGVEHTATTRGDSYKQADRLRNSLTVAPWISRRVYADGDGVVEMPTPVMRTRDEVERCWADVEAACRRRRLTRWDPDVPSGGGHIHLGLPTGRGWTGGRRGLFLANFITELTEHPELNWCMNEPIDDANANCWAGSTVRFDPRDVTRSRRYDYYWRRTRWTLRTPEETRSREGFRSAWRRFAAREGLPAAGPAVVRPYDLALMEARTGHPRGLAGLKGYAAVHNKEYGTVELRVFDAPRDLPEHMFQLDVALALWERCAGAARRGESLPRSEQGRRRMAATTEERAWAKFRGHLESLGLGGRPEAARFRENLRRRYALVRERQVGLK